MPSTHLWMPRRSKTKKRRTRKRRQTQGEYDKHLRKVEKKVQYHAYMNSRRWRRKRASLIKARGSRCEDCGTTKRLTVHHKHYRTLGHERVRDVEVLCWQCHKERHVTREESHGHQTAGETDYLQATGS